MVKDGCQWEKTHHKKALATQFIKACCCGHVREPSMARSSLYAFMQGGNHWMAKAPAQHGGRRVPRDRALNMTLEQRNRQVLQGDGSGDIHHSPLLDEAFELVRARMKKAG